MASPAVYRSALVISFLFVGIASDALGYSLQLASDQVPTPAGQGGQAWRLPSGFPQPSTMPAASAATSTAPATGAVRPSKAEAANPLPIQPGRDRGLITAAQAVQASTHAKVAEPPVGDYVCYSGFSAVFVNPAGGTGIKWSPGAFGGYVFILPNHRYAAGYSADDKKNSAQYHIDGERIVADTGYWKKSNAIVRYDPSRDVPTIFYTWPDVQGAYGCRLKSVG